MVRKLKKEVPSISDDIKYIMLKLKKYCTSFDKNFKFRSDLVVHMKRFHDRAVFTAELGDRGRLKCFYSGNPVKQVKRKNI